jgi:hypothetical protein
MSNGCLNDAPCPPFTIHGTSIRQPLGAGGWWSATSATTPCRKIARGDYWAARPSATRYTRRRACLPFLLGTQLCRLGWFLRAARGLVTATHTEGVDPAAGQSLDLGVFGGASALSTPPPTSPPTSPRSPASTPEPEPEPRELRAAAAEDDLEDFLIPTSELQLGRKLAAGAYGTVYRGSYLGPVAVKVRPPHRYHL